MRFTTSAIAAVAIVANSASLGEGRRKLIDTEGPNRRREALRTLFRNSKPMWEELKDPSTDLRTSMRDEEHECDLDVGILECGMDQVCVPSPKSERGGVCQSLLWEQNSRELQDNATLPTLPDSNSTDTAGQDFFEKFCQYPSTACDCSNFDNVTLEGEISCTDPDWCDRYDETLCGISTVTYSIESGSVIVSYCAEVATERFCYSGDLSTDDYQCLSASMNGCECTCELTSTGCSVNDTSGVYFTCPNNVTSDGCNGFASLFGDKVKSCELTSAPTNITSTASPTQSPLTTSPTQSPATLTPSKQPTDAPVAVEADEPSASPVSKTPAPTSSSNMYFKSCFQVASVVTTVAIIGSYWV